MIAPTHLTNKNQTRSNKARILALNVRYDDPINPPPLAVKPRLLDVQSDTHLINYVPCRYFPYSTSRKDIRKHKLTGAPQNPLHHLTMSGRHHLQGPRNK